MLALKKDYHDLIIDSVQDAAHMRPVALVELLLVAQHQVQEFERVSERGQRDVISLGAQCAGQLQRNVVPNNFTLIIGVY
jgi:hypothetical protein